MSSMPQDRAEFVGPATAHEDDFISTDLVVYKTTRRVVGCAGSVRANPRPRIIPAAGLVVKENGVKVTNDT